MNPAVNHEELWKKIDNVLWEEWDPLGVNDYGGPDDEYRSYVPSIFKLLVAGKSVDEIAQKLNHHATIELGVFPDKKHNIKIAEKLITLMKEH